MRSYGAVLRLPGAGALIGTSLPARAPMAMLSLGTVLLVSAESGSYALAGAVSAVGTVAAAVIGPAASRLIDRHGQARVARPLLLVHVTLLALLAWAVTAGTPTWTWFVLATFGLGTQLPVGAMVRARWSAMAPPAVLGTAFALESVLDEVVFVAGPVIATTVATSIEPWAGLAAAMVLGLSGGLALLAQRRTEPPVTTAPSEGGALRVRGVIALVVVFAFMGVVFGGAELAVVAICEEAGRPGASGVLLALWAMGSLVAGLAYGTVAWRRHPASRLVPAVAGFAVGAALLPLAAGTLPALAVAFAVCGAAIAPTVIAGFATVERLVPPGSLTEGFTWLATALQVGFAASLTITGQVVDAVSPRAGLVVPAAAACLAAVVSLVVRHQAVPARA